MKDLAKRFLTDADRKEISDAVKKAEQVTSGEIVPMIVSTSYHYPMADVIGGVVFALPISLLLTYLFEYPHLYKQLPFRHFQRFG